MGHASYHKYVSSSHRNVPPDSRRSRSNKRGHDEDESSWSDSGSEDSILGQASYKSHASKVSKTRHPQAATTTMAMDNATSEDTPDQGSGTPPGEPPLPEDKERHEKLLDKLKQIEDMLSKNKQGEKQDPM